MQAQGAGGCGMSVRGEAFLGSRALVVHVTFRSLQAKKAVKKAVLNA
jgi:hypothetical protein